MCCKSWLLSQMALLQSCSEPCLLTKASRNLPVEPVTAHMGEAPREELDVRRIFCILLQVWFNQEIVMPMSASMLEASGHSWHDSRGAVLGFENVPLARLQVGLALEMVSSTPDGALTDSLLNLQWSPSSLPFLNPIHLHARSSAATSASSASRPRPGLLVSITREPGHEALDGLGGGVSHGLEIRVHGVPHGRPLPDLVEGGLVAVCPESSVGTDTRDLRIPVATYLYDQRIELSAFLDEHFITAASNARCFLSPLSGASRTPQWGQFLLRCLSSTTSLKAVTILLFECRGARADPDSPLSGNLLGFASLDASSLIGSEPMSRSFLLDLRLLEAPGASTSLEIEARVWPRGGGGTAEGPHGKSAPAPASALAPSAALAQEVQDFRLNHELSVQLSKEFNMRAAALKRAGEEIVTLRRQVQLLKNENRSLRAQVEDEEKLAHEVQQRPPPEGLEKLSAAELAGKLQRTLEKYREEKAKASELTRRMEEALKEVNRARGLERSLEELQQVHLEQNRELQRLQDEGRKLDTYRQTAKTQEKVISKLEKILESSLQEVQKAQKVQVDIERLKTENLKLRERCSSLLTRKKEVGDDEAQELRQRLAEKDAEITRLQKVAASLKMNNVEVGEETVLPSSSPGTAALSAEEQEQLAHLEAKRFEWEQRCAAAEQRLQVLQQQLTESSKRYGAEISSLEVEIAKKDARIKEFEFLQRQTACTVRAIRPEHLSALQGTPPNDAEIPRSSGSEVSASVEDVVQEASEISKLSTAERFPQKGARAKLVGLKAKSMNGKVVKITSYENSTQRYIVKLPDGSMRKVEASKLQSTDEAPRPRLSVCNAYKLHEPLKVVLNSETGTSKVLAMLDFASCEDFEELPFDKGSISLLLSSMQVANVPFDLSVLGPGRGTELTVAPSESTAGRKSKAKVLQNIVELDDGGAYYLHLVNAHVGSRSVQLSVQRGPVAKVLPMDKSYRLERVEDMSLTLMDGERRLRLAFNPQKSRTYCAIVTGGSDGENQDAQRVGLVLHKLGEWTSAEQLDKEAV
ncbi:CCDC33 [Symbiodinium sp. CCMP2592]|nr:CCDC33 [Symbiodinium sp. CCMP2592]